MSWDWDAMNSSTSGKYATVNEALEAMEAESEAAEIARVEQEPLPTRWKEKGLNMPPRPKSTIVWGLKEMAAAAGISVDELHAAARERAQNLQGSDIYYSLEQMISDRYTEMQNFNYNSSAA